MLDGLRTTGHRTIGHQDNWAPSDGHDKPFCTKAITIIDNFKKALGDTDKSQFLKAISIIDKLSPINFSDKCCGKFSTCLTKDLLLVDEKPAILRKYFMLQ